MGKEPQLAAWQQLCFDWTRPRRLCRLCLPTASLGAAGISTSHLRIWDVGSWWPGEGWKKKKNPERNKHSLWKRSRDQSESVLSKSQVRHVVSTALWHGTEQSLSLWHPHKTNTPAYRCLQQILRRTIHADINLQKNLQEHVQCLLHSQTCFPMNYSNVWLWEHCTYKIL